MPTQPSGVSMWFSKFLEHLVETATFQIIIPAMILFFVLSGLVIVLISAQFSKTNKFDITEFLLDDQGRFSAIRAWGFVGLGVHCWWATTLVFQSRDTPDHFLWFGLIWAGTPVAAKLADRWGGNLPFAPAGSTQPAPPPATTPPPPAPAPAPGIAP